jgi:hypothetical protein
MFLNADIAARKHYCRKIISMQFTSHGDEACYSCTACGRLATTFCGKCWIFELSIMMLAKTTFHRRWRVAACNKDDKHKKAEVTEPAFETFDLTYWAHRYSMA